MPCISLWQPWAQAVVTKHPNFYYRGLKEYETRSFRPPHKHIGQRILIHAAKKYENWQKDLLSSKTISDSIGNPFNKFHESGDLVITDKHFGAIVGSVLLLSVITSEQFYTSGPSYSRTPTDEWAMGDWTSGRFGWKLANPVLFDVPVPLKGMQGFWNVPVNKLPEDFKTFLKTPIRL
jgi:hypothetical protein